MSSVPSMAEQSKKRPQNIDPEDEEDGDTSICIIWAGDGEIHAAAGLPQAPPGLLGTNPAITKTRLVQWFDRIVLTQVQLGIDVLDKVLDKDVDGVVVPGSYSGVREGEWNRIIAALGTREIRLWAQAMDSNVPPLSCSKIRVTSGFHGRGRNCTSFPKLGPFLS